MIIRATFKDNDFTNRLEKYFDNFLFSNYYTAINDISDPKEYKDKRIEAEEMLDKVIYKSSELTEKDKNLFADIITKSILAFYQYNYGDDNIDYLAKNIEVSIINSLEDKWENGEVVYYLITSRVSLTQ